MSLVAVKCSQCGAKFEIDDTKKETMVCMYCGTAFVTEKDAVVSQEKKDVAVINKIPTKMLVVIAMLCAMAYLLMFFIRIPVVLFLKYEPKDIIITIGGFLYGPLVSFVISVVVSFIEMFTASDTGPIGALMNIISSCAFACTAAVIYKRKRNLKGAVIGLIAGWLFTTAVMLLWNYFITPVYMKVPREAVAKLLIPAFLPFNLLKGGLNAAIIMLIYKPLVNALRLSGLLPKSDEGIKSKGKVLIGSIIISSFVIITCILLILVFQGVI